MGFLGALWLPIVLSAVIVFVGSSVIHMVLPFHKNDYSRLPDEEKARTALRGVARGWYVIPYCTHKDMKSPEVLKKYEEGPVGLLTVFPSGPPALPKFLGMWFIFCLVISFFTAYLAWHTVTAGSNYLVVFRVAGTAAFMAYGLGGLSNGIWKGLPWGNVIKEAFDGLIYALLTAGTFGWLWPR